MEDRLTRREARLHKVAKDIQVPVDTNAIWDKLEGQLPPQENNKKRFAWWYFPSAVGLMIVGAFLYSLISNIATPSSAEKIELKEALTLNETPAQITKNDVNNLSENIQVETNTSKITPNRNISTTARPQQQNKQPQTQSNSSVNNSNSLYPATPQANFREYNQSSSNTNSEQIIPITMNSNSEEIRDKSEDIASRLSPETALISSPKNTLKHPSDIGFINSNVTGRGPDFNLSIQPLNKSYWQPYLMLKSGVNINQTSLENGVGEPIGYPLASKETLLPGISTDLTYGMENRSGWRWNIGLAHNMLTSRYYNTDKDITSTPLAGDASFKIDDEGNIIGLGGDLTKTTIVQNDISWYNIHQYLDLKIGVGKRIFDASNFGITVDAGLNYGIWSTHDGYILNEENEFITYTSSENHPYRNRGISGNISLGAEYKIGRMTIGLSPFISKTFNANSANYQYRTKNSQYGLQLLTAYKL